MVLAPVLKMSNTSDGEVTQLGAETAAAFRVGSTIAVESVV
jgi:hypothetical protein